MMGQARNWTASELTYLQDAWGTKSIATIARRLGRTVVAVKVKAQRTGLTDARQCADGLTLNALAGAMGVRYSTARFWKDELGLPVHRKIFAISHPVLIVQYDEWWTWAASHLDRLNFARLEPKLLGPEPAWVAVKRKADQQNYSRIPRRPWSAQDDQHLIRLVTSYRYTSPEIAQKLQRTEGAIKR